MFLFQVDGCKNYSVLSEADRAQGNYALPDPPYYKYDTHRVTGWYRFQGAAGDQMQDKCVPTGRCGTKHPGWLESTQLTIAEGVVTRKVCFSGPQNCCSWSTIIKVKNISDYHVYELQRMQYLYYRYCGNACACNFHSFYKMTYLVGNLNEEADGAEGSLLRRQTLFGFVTQEIAGKNL